MDKFPQTAWSEALADTNDDERRKKLALLAERYWKPVYWAFRIHGTDNDPEALQKTRRFLARVIDETIHPRHASFRSHLAATFHAFRLEENLPPYAGEGASLNLDFNTLEFQAPPSKSDPHATLNLLWARQVLEEAVGDLRFTLAAADKGRDFEIFRSYDMADDAGRPPVEAVATQTGVSALTAQTALTSCRRKLRTALLKKISNYVKNEDGLFDELRVLFGE